MLLDIYMTSALIVGIVIANLLIGESHIDNHVITFRKIKDLWNSRNIFGRTQIVVFTIFFFPGVIMGIVFIFVLFIIVTAVMKFLDLGRKK